MIILEGIAQGSDEWHCFRSHHHGSSECASMLGLSKKTSRTELMHIKHTGIAKEFSPWLQENVLDKGHKVEAMARPLIEKIIGRELYPVTCSEGMLSASCDGLSMCGLVAFEHKQLNSKYAKMVDNGIVPDEHIPQCQQILLVTGAAELYFVVSDGTPEELRYVVVIPDAEWFARIIAGWEQFDKDLAAYTPPEVIPAATAAPIMALPALTVQVSGAITITDNLALFGEKLQSFIGGLNTKPEDDQGFADIESAVKVLQKAQDALEASEANALSQVATVDEMRRTVKLYIEMARDTRLMLDKVVKQRKEQIKLEFIARANDAHRQHIEGLEAEIVPIRLSVVKPDFAGAAKNKRNIASLRDSLETALAGAKIEADAAAQRVRINLATFNELASKHRYLFNDLQTLMQKPNGDCMDAIKLRVIEYKQDEAVKLESERRRIQIEEEKKAEAKLQSELRAAVVEEVEKIGAERANIQKQESTKLVPQITAETNSMIENLVDKPRACKPPSRDEIIATISFTYAVSESTATEWLVKEFQQRAA